MDTQEDLQNIGEDFYTHMEDLTFNSRPIITNLTIIAEENTDAALYIVKAVEKRIEKALQAHKLFVFYLLDSICKNIGSPYTLLFGDNLFKTFTTAYVSMDDATRRKMIDLFKTWLTAKNSSGLPLFPSEPIKKIEEFLIRASTLYKSNIQVVARQTPTPTLPQINTNELIDLINAITLLSREKLKIIPNDTESQNKLLVLGQVKNAIQAQVMDYAELMKAKNMLQGMFKSEEEALKALVTPPQPSLVPAVPQQQQPLQQQQQQQQTDQQPQHPLKRQFQQFINSSATATATATTETATPAPSSTATTTTSNSSNPLGLSSATAAKIAVPKANYDDLFKKLLKAKLVKYKRQKLPSKQLLRSLLVVPEKQQEPTTSAATTATTAAAQEFHVIDLTEFDINSSGLLKKASYDTFHKLMFANKPNKCAQCGKRFGNSQKELKIRADHLDWHFRVNSKLQNSTVIPSKAWYLDDVEFFKFRDFELFYSREDLTYADHQADFISPDQQAFRDSSSAAVGAVAASSSSSSSTPSNIKHYVTVPETSVDMQTQCGICREIIKGEYDDDLGEWVYKDSVQGPQGKIFHWACFNEANNKKKSNNNNNNFNAAGGGFTGIKRKYELDLD